MVWGVIAAVALAQLLGAAWYSPYIFGTLWLKETFPYKTKDAISEQAASAYALTLVSSAGIALMLNIILVNFFNVKTVLEAIKFALGLAFLTTLVDTPHLAFSQRSLIAYLIDHGFDCLSLFSMAACIFYLS